MFDFYIRTSLIQILTNQETFINWIYYWLFKMNFDPVHSPSRHISIEGDTVVYEGQLGLISQVIPKGGVRSLWKYNHQKWTQWIQNFIYI